MACTSCAKKKANSYQDFKSLESPPYRATDIFVYDIKEKQHRKFESSDWNTEITNVLLFFPSIESISEIGDITPQEGIEYIYVTNQPLHEIVDYLENSDIKLAAERIFVSYLLPSRMNLLYNGFTKKAVVYIMKDGDTSMNQLFYNSSFNYKHISEFIDDYKTDSN